MNNFKQEMLAAEAKKLKQEAIDEIGAIDFHFQIPKFDSPLLMIPAILHELTEFGSSMLEFHTERIDSSDPIKALDHALKASLFNIWNTWNTVIGIVLTSKDPEIMNDFNEMMKSFAEKQILKTKKGN